MTQANEIAEMIWTAFVSPNECDSNLEPMNVVDALSVSGRRIAAALEQIGDALGRLADEAKIENERGREALDEIRPLPPPPIPMRLARTPPDDDAEIGLSPRPPA